MITTGDNDALMVHLTTINNKNTLYHFSTFLTFPFFSLRARSGQCVQSFETAFQIAKKNLVLFWNSSIDFEDFERMSEDKEASQYFEKIRSLYTYRDEKLMRSVLKKKVETVEDEDDEVLLA